MRSERSLEEQRRENISKIIRRSPYLAFLFLALSYIIHLASPIPSAFYIPVILLGAISFTLLWHHWKRPGRLYGLFNIIASTQTLIILKENAFPNATFINSMTFLAGFLGLNFGVQCLLIWLFKKPITMSLCGEPERSVTLKKLD